MQRAISQALILSFLLAATSSCRRDSGNPPGPAASASAGALAPDLAGKVLAQVGDRTITLADYVAALDRMDQFERLRYQSPERRQKLLDELIDVELLAREAEKRGLGDRPEAQELIRQLLRDELLKRLRDNQPKLEELPVDKVRSYYDAHRSEFREPERRRVSHIVLRDRALAEEVLQKAKKASAVEWGELVERYSLDRGQSSEEDPNATKPPPELAGDLGLVSAPGSDRGENPRISEPVRVAAFKLAELGQVYDQLVESGGQFEIVRLMGKSGARDRSFAEAERTIRVQILQEMIDQSEKDLLAELKKTIPVEINETALGQVKAPEPRP